MQNVRKKILLLNLITLIPTILLLIYLNITHFKKSENVEVENLKNITSLVAAENQQVIENVRHLLITISALPEIQNPSKNCNSLLSDIATKYQRYGNIGVTDPNGNVICSAVSTQEKINLSDRLFFQETIKRNDFSAGEYVVSRSTGKASINFGYPRKSGNGVIYATLNLDWLNNLTANLDIDKNLVVLVLDTKGVVIARYPDPDKWIGEKFPNHPVANNTNQDSGLIETTGIDNIERIYAFESLNKNIGPYVLVGQTKKSIYSAPSNDLFKQIVIAIGIVAISIYSGLLVGKSLIIKTIERLKELNRLRKDFISLISHQIRTPATSIKWFNEILLSESLGKINSKQKSILKDTQVSIKRMIELIGNILSITKLENSKIKLDKKQVDITRNILDILKIVSIEFKTKDIKYEVKTTHKNNIVSLDEKFMYQVFYNLIHNAFKYSEKYGTVKIVIRKNNKQLIVNILDNGIGIPQSEMKNMFVKFSRASNARLIDTEGAGLGLYLSKLIINKHGGKIKIVKQKKTGTLVLVTIPLI